LAHRREQAELRVALERKRAAQPEPSEPTESQEPRHVQCPISAVPLPSAETDYRFLFSGTVCWNQTGEVPGVRHANPGDVAVNWILARARELTVLEKPDDYRLTQYRLAVSLGAAVTEPQGQVVAWATDITLTVPDEDLRRLSKLSELRKHERVWDYERRLEIDMRRYLSEDVFKDSGSAVVWWLARHIDQIEDGVRLIGALGQLTAAAHNREIPELHRSVFTGSIVGQVAEHDELTYARLAALSDFLQTLQVTESANGTATDLFGHGLAKFDPRE
jgi:hypothetical protein